MVPLSPTATYNGLEVVVEESSFLPQEKMMKLKRSSESGMSICFTWFPFWWFRRTQYIPRFGDVLQGSVKIVEGVCEL